MAILIRFSAITVDNSFQKLKKPARAGFYNIKNNSKEVTY